MMPDNNDLNGKVGLDTTGFKASVSELNAQIRAIETGFRASAAVMGDWSSRSDGLKERTSSLSSKLDLQRQKLSLLHQEYRKVTESEGAGSKAAQSLANQMYSCEKVISSTENELQKYDQELKNFGKDSKKIDLSGFRSSLSSIGSGVVTGIKAAGAAIAGIGATAAGAAAGIIKLSNSASDLNESQNVVQQTFKKSSKSVIDWTNTITQSSGIGKQAATTMVGTMGAMLKSGGQTEEAARSMSESLTQLSGDLSSFYNISSQDAFEKIRSGISGETEPLKELGINMSVANLQAYAMSQGITKSYNSMSQAEQTTLRYNYLMSVTKDAQGDFARTSGGMANQTRLMKENISNLSQTIGSKFLPSINSVLPSMNGVISSMTAFIATGIGADQITSSVSNLATRIANAANALLPQIGSMISVLSGLLSGLIPKILPSLINIGVQLITQIVSSFVSAIPQILPALTNGVLQLLNTFISIINNNAPILIQAGVSALITLAKGLINALPNLISAAIQMILTLVNSLKQQLPTLIPVAINAIITIVNEIIANLPSIIRAAIQIVIALIQGISNALPQLIAEIPKIIVGIIQVLVSALPQIIKAAPQIIVALIMGIVNAIPLLINEAPQIIIALAKALIQAVPQLLTLGPKILTGIWNGLKNQNWRQIGGNIIKGIIDGFADVGRYISDGVKKAANAIESGFKSIFGIHSPSTLMRDEIGTNLGLGIVEGIKSTAGQAADAMRNLTSFGGNVGVNYSVNGRVSGSTPVINNNQYGAQQQVTVLQIGAEKVASVVTPTISNRLAMTQYMRRRAPRYV